MRSHQRVMSLWVNERGSLPSLPFGRKSVLFVDNCSDHNMTDELAINLFKINTDIRYFPSNETDLLQPADSFFIQNKKAAWSKRWDKYRARFLRSIVDNGSYGTRSGTIPNPGKDFFLKSPAQAVRDVNNQHDDTGMIYARKSMICFGLGKQPNGLC